MEAPVVFFFLLVGVAIAVIAFVAIRLAKKADEAWAAAARRLGLRYVPGALFKARNMSGQLGEAYTKVDTYTRGSGKNSTTYTRFRVEYPQPLGIGLSLSRQGFFSSITKAFGAQDIEIGDQAFDDEVVVKGDDARAVTQFLTEGRRVRLLRLLHTYSGITIEDQGLEWSRRGVLREASDLIDVVEDLVGTALAISSSDEREQTFDRAVTARAAGDLEGALTHLQEMKTAPPPLPLPAETPARPGVDEAVMEAQILYLEGRREEAKEVIDDVAERIPESPAIEGWKQLADEPEPEAKPEPATTTGASASEADEALTADAVCTALFSTELSGFEASRLFEAEYQNRLVEGEGRLVKVESYAFDYVLGSEGGTKARIEVYELPKSWVGGKWVAAVVGLPADAEDPLKELEGRRVRFRGELAKLDAFMHNLYVRGGTCEAAGTAGEAT